MMKLVDYSSSDSDDNDSDNEIASQPPALRPGHAALPPKPAKKQIIVDLPKPSRSEDNEPIKKRVRPGGEGGGGLFSILPPPKRSKPTMNGNATKEAAIDVKPVEETGESSVTVTTTTFMPRSTQAKKGKPVAKPPPKPSVSLFPLGPELASKQSAPTPSNPSTYEPLIAQPLLPIIDPPPSEPEFIPDTTAPPPATLSTADLDTFAAHILEGRHRKNRTIEIVDYNAGEMYAQNAADKASGVLQEQIAPVRAIGSGRHQLTQLLNNVQDQRESLEEAFAKGRRVKKESGAKYGW
jgi:hypothetical protein